MYKKILVVANPHLEEQPALIRAIDIARREPITKITVFISQYDLSYDMTAMLSKDQREAMRAGMLKQKEMWLEKMCKPYKDEGFAIEFETQWYKRSYEAILKYAENHHYDLIIKATRKHDKLGTIFYTPTDWHLIRKSACPLLLVKDSAFPEKANVIAAVDLSGEYTDNARFNEKIVREAKRITQKLGGQLFIATTYPATPGAISVELPEFNPEEFRHAIEAQIVKKMDELAEKFDIPKKQTIVQEGLAGKTIPRIAKELDAKIVVVETQGHTGLAATFIGNVAEDIIDKLDCSLLALKPDGYISLYKED